MPSGTLSSPTSQLCRLFMREEAACRALLETVAEERAAIRALAIAEFHPINSRRLAILESLRALAEERALIVQRLAAVNGLPPDTTAIHAVIDRSTGPESDELRTRYAAFLATAKLVRDEIKQNVVLIEGIRGVVDRALTAGTMIVPGPDLYTNDGRSATVTPVNAVIHQRG